MGYPAPGYRNGAKAYNEGLSKPSAPSPPKPAPQPANDNKPRPPGLPSMQPANDNVRAKAPPFKLPEGAAGALKLAKLALPLFKIHPLLRMLLNLYNLYELLPEMDPVVPGSGPWVKVCGPDPSIFLPPNPYIAGPQRYDVGANVCGLKGQAANQPVWTPASRNLGIAFSNRPFGGSTIAWYEIWTRPADGSVANPPYEVPWIATDPVPWFRFPWLDPMLIPPGAPRVPTPKPPPYPVIPTRPVKWPSDRGNAAPDNGPLYDPDPGPVQSPWSPTVPIGRRVPPKNTKEKKFQSKIATQRVLAAFFDLAKAHGKLADLRDYLGAFNDALPKEFQLKGKAKKRIPDLLENVWKHLDKVKGEEALLNLISEIAEDVIGGVGDRFRHEAAKNLNWMKNKIYTSPRF